MRVSYTNGKETLTLTATMHFGPRAHGIPCMLLSNGGYDYSMCNSSFFVNTKGISVDFVYGVLLLCVW